MKCCQLCKHWVRMSDMPLHGTCYSETAKGDVPVPGAMPNYWTGAVPTHRVQLYGKARRYNDGEKCGGFDQ